MPKIICIRFYLKMTFVNWSNVHRNGVYTHFFHDWWLSADSHIMFVNAYSTVLTLNCKNSRDFFLLHSFSSYLHFTFIYVSIRFVVLNDLFLDSCLPFLSLKRRLLFFFLRWMELYCIYLIYDWIVTCRTSPFIKWYLNRQSVMICLMIINASITTVSLFCDVNHFFLFLHNSHWMKNWIFFFTKPKS